MPEIARAPAEVRLEDLTDVHAARNAERVQDDVDRRPSCMYGMSSSGRMRLDDALVAVTAGHLVADLELALDGDVDLHHLDHARRQLVALAEQALDLLLEVLFVERGPDSSSCAGSCSILSSFSSTGISPQYLRGICIEQLVGELLALLQEDLALVVDELAVGGLCRRAAS